MFLILEKLKNLPIHPGCYIFHDQDGLILYIGKAKSLRARVRSYFKQEHHDIKTSALVEKIFDIETIITDTELEAFLLEARLIRQHQPPYNMVLKGSSRYAYIRLTDELFPRLETARAPEANETVFGPYASATARRTLIRLTNHLFRLRMGKQLPVQLGNFYQIKCAVPPWTRLVTLEEYTQDIEHARLLLKGDVETLLKKLTTDMQAYAQQRRYELAKLCRDQITALRHLQEDQKIELRKRYNQHVVVGLISADEFVVHILTINKGVVTGRDMQHVPLQAGSTDASELLVTFLTQYYLDRLPPDEIIIEHMLPQTKIVEQYLAQRAGRPVRLLVPKRGAKVRLLRLVKKDLVLHLSHGDRAVFALQEALSLAQSPRVIECFDISNLGSKHIVASMVQFRDGASAKSEYRRFAIRYQGGQSDVDAMREVVTRRYQRLLAEKKPLPDLVMVDGGKPQLLAAWQALRSLGLRLPLIALAKQEEEIFIPGRIKSLRLAKSHDGLQLLQRIRDEAHRFAITYNRLLRRKALASQLKARQ